MPTSFDGNDGNDGNSANSGGGGNSTSTSGGWFFADRVNLPFVTAPDTGFVGAAGETTGELNIINITKFPTRNWSAEWYSWLALNEFVQPGWNTFDPTVPPVGAPGGGLANPPKPNPWVWPGWIPAPPNPGNPKPVPDWTDNAVVNQANIQTEIDNLVTAAENERADALGEILSQSNEFISYFLNTMTARPGAYPATTKLLGIASLIGTFVAMYYKAMYTRPRPTQLCPALLSPIEVPGHASLPSGHSTQAHLMALCIYDVIVNLPQQQTMMDDLWTLADRIARNREIAGLHYDSDTQSGIAFAYHIHAKLAGNRYYEYTLALAKQEWDAPGVIVPGGVP